MVLNENIIKKGCVKDNSPCKNKFDKQKKKPDPKKSCDLESILYKGKIGKSACKFKTRKRNHKHGHETRHHQSSSAGVCGHIRICFPERTPHQYRRFFNTQNDRNDNWIHCPKKEKHLKERRRRDGGNTEQSGDVDQGPASEDAEGVVGSTPLANEVAAVERRRQGTEEEDS